MAQEDHTSKAVTPVASVATTNATQVTAQATTLKPSEETKSKTEDETTPKDTVEIGSDVEKDKAAAQTSQTGTGDDTKKTDETDKSKPKEKVEDPEAEQKEQEQKLKELEDKIEALKQKIMEDAKKGDMDTLDADVKELEGLEEEKQALLQAMQPQTGISQAAPAASSASAAPLASYPSYYPTGSPAGYAPAAFPVTSVPRTGNRVPVTNDTTPVAGRPHGLSEIKRTFGEPGTNLVTVKMPAGPGGKMINVTCNAKIADKMKAAFEEIKEKGLSDEIHSFDGCYNYRNKRGGSTLSTHAWGIAFDINASENPMGSTHQTAGQKQLAEIFAKYGFYQLPHDPMHFQYCTGY
jgi:hypothetical protein